VHAHPCSWGLKVMIKLDNMASETSKDVLYYADTDRTFLEPHLPPRDALKLHSERAWATLTFATSLDSQLALSPGVRTQLSGPQSKAMTHYLRSRHDAIMIGVGTAIADDPGLNCRLSGTGGYGGEDLTGQPRPIIIDPTCRWNFSEDNKIFHMVRQKKGKCPFIITGMSDHPVDRRKILERNGGKYISLQVQQDENGENKLDWRELLQCLKREGLSSVMIEGGGAVINSLLESTSHDLVDSVIITIAPTWLGQGGVLVTPKRRTENGQLVPASRLKNVSWKQFGEDVVLCGQVRPLSN
jgi:2,5-diamino-6-(ribosylamino)-4(3H)-pyrimidinone 5'-phosphate reductase